MNTKNKGGINRPEQQGDNLLQVFNSEFSFFKRPIKNIKPHETVDLRQIYSKIVGNDYKNKTHELRAISNKKQAQVFKATNFDYCTFSGVFNSRSNTGLKKYSGLLCVDFDHLQNIDVLRNQLLKDEYFDTQLLFVSPSGDGLKWVIPIPSNQETHGNYFDAIANYILQIYYVEIDKSGRDISRACFLPHDPHAFIKKDEVIMSKKTFNPNDWTNSSKTAKQAGVEIDKYSNIPNGNLANWQNDNLTEMDIETITAQIEATAVDIAPNYPDWVKLGFALVDALGERGRSYYHRISCFYPSYSQSKTDEQFDKCLKSKGQGITKKTFLYFAKEAGVDIAISPNIQNGNLAKSNEERENKTLPVFPEKIYSSLPDYLRKITNYSHSREDADLFLLGSLVVFSACLPNVHGIYGGVAVYPNLFLFVSAQASAGKGRLSLCRRLVEPIHRQLRELNKLELDKYKRQQAEYTANRKNPGVELPQEPPLRVLFIPANSSATAVFQVLGDNQGVGLIFETEGDTLAQTFKSEHGNYSDGFRKAFHHEKISYLRRKDKEYVTLDIPKLSVLLSGTSRQISSLIPDAENGLFSRFMFYYMKIRLQWVDVFAHNKTESLDQCFDRLGEDFFDFYRILKQCESIHFSLSDSQQIEFNEYFERVQQQYWGLLGNDIVGTIRRLGLIAFRIAMVLTVLRMMDTGNINRTIVCSNHDFQTAMEITKVLLQHAAFVFRQLPQSTTATQNDNPKMIFFSELPPSFDRTKYIEIAERLEIPESTANKQIARLVDSGLLTRQTRGNYTKNNMNMKI